MAVTLKKGQGVSLKKSDNDLSQVVIGLGWDVADDSANRGFLGKLFAKKQEDYDLDAIAFLIGENGKVQLSRQLNDEESDVIFYNHMKHKSGAIWLTGDNRTGAGDGDDEQIIIMLNQLPEKYKKIALVVQIYKGIERTQSFSKIRNAFIRAVDKNDKEMCRFDLSGDPTYSECRSLVFAELEREGANWKFTAIGKPYTSDTFLAILQDYT